MFPCYNYWCSWRCWYISLLKVTIVPAIKTKLIKQTNKRDDGIWIPDVRQHRIPQVFAWYWENFLSQGCCSIFYYITLPLHYITVTLHYRYITLPLHSLPLQYITVTLITVTLHYRYIKLQLHYITVTLHYRYIHYRYIDFP